MLVQRKDMNRSILFIIAQDVICEFQIIKFVYLKIRIIYKICIYIN